MKIFSNTLSGFRIVPENDSDRYVMEAWSKSVPRILSSGVQCDFPGCSGITIGFDPAEFQTDKDKEGSAEPGLSEMPKNK